MILGVYFEEKGPVTPREHPRFRRARKLDQGYVLIFPYGKASRKKQMEWAQDVQKHLKSWGLDSQIIQVGL